jgi:hypothetical protein
MIEIWFRFRFLLLLLIIITITFSSHLFFNEKDGSIQIPIIGGLFLWWFYLASFYQFANENYKEYHLSQVRRNFLSGKYLTIISYHLMNAYLDISDKEKAYFENFMRYEYERKYIVRYYIKNLIRPLQNKN